MNLHITKSKNAESFYICKSYVKANGSTTSTIVRKLGTLEQLLPEHGPTRDDVAAWTKNEAKIETEKYKKENFSLFPENANEQTSLKPLEKKGPGDFGCQKFIYCSDAGLGSESIRECNHMGAWAYIITQSIKKLKKEEKE